MCHKQVGNEICTYSCLLETKKLPANDYDKALIQNTVDRDKLS